MTSRTVLVFGLSMALGVLVHAGSSPLRAGEIAWEEHIVDGDFNGAEDALAADIDGDGDLDVLGAAGSADEVAWWENALGDGTAWIEHVVAEDFDGARSVYAADVDGDSDLDVIAAASSLDEVSWWENVHGDGTSWSKHLVDANVNGAEAVFATDLDGDGDVDVLAAAWSADAIVWWENVSGDGTLWSTHVVDTDVETASAVWAADINGDQSVDIVGASWSPGSIMWWENAGGARAWIEHVVDADFDGVRTVEATDLDGDLDLDVLAAASQANQIAWWENTTGDGTLWTEHTIAANFDAAYAAVAADIDRDGDDDVVGAGIGADEIKWWENVVGDGTVWVESIVDVGFDSPHSVHVADINGDEGPDVLSAAFVGDQIAWWESLDACEISLTLRHTTLSAGGTLELSLHLKHNRAETVTMPLAFWVLDSLGREVLNRVTAPMTVEHGDELSQEYAWPLPESLTAGEYELVVGTREMQQGIAWARSRFEVVLAPQ